MSMDEPNSFSPDATPQSNCSGVRTPDQWDDHWASQWAAQVQVFPIPVQPVPGQHGLVPIAVPLDAIPQHVSYLAQRIIELESQLGATQSRNLELEAKLRISQLEARLGTSEEIGRHLEARLAELQSSASQSRDELAQEIILEQDEIKEFPHGDEVEQSASSLASDAEQQQEEHFKNVRLLPNSQPGLEDPREEQKDRHDDVLMQSISERRSSFEPSDGVEQRLQPSHHDNSKPDCREALEEEHEEPRRDSPKQTVSEHWSSNEPSDKHEQKVEAQHEEKSNPDSRQGEEAREEPCSDLLTRCTSEHKHVCESESSVEKKAGLLKRDKSQAKSEEAASSIHSKAKRRNIAKRLRENESHCTAAAAGGRLEQACVKNELHVHAPDTKEKKKKAKHQPTRSNGSRSDHGKASKHLRSANGAARDDDWELLVPQSRYSSWVMAIPFTLALCAALACYSRHSTTDPLPGIESSIENYKDVSSGREFRSRGELRPLNKTASEQRVGAISKPANANSQRKPRSRDAGVAVEPVASHRSVRNQTIEPREPVETFGDLGGGANKWWSGAIATNGFLYAIPCSASEVLRIDPSSNSIKRLGAGLLGDEPYKWIASVLANNGIIYGIPASATSVLRVDPSSDSVTKFGHLETQDYKWTCAVLADNDAIYALPNAADHVLKIHSTSNSLTLLKVPAPSSPGNSKFKWTSGVRATNGVIYGIPAHMNSVIKIDPASDEITLIGGLTNKKNKWFIGILASNDVIYALPSSAKSILKINTRNDKLSSIGNFDDAMFKYMSGAVSKNGIIYGIPFQATSILKINPKSDTVETFGAIEGEGSKWRSAELGANGAIFAIPWNASRILTIDPSSQTIGYCGSFKAGNKWRFSAVAPNGYLYSIPLSAESILKVDTSDVTACTSGLRVERRVMTQVGKSDI